MGRERGGFRGRRRGPRPPRGRRPSRPTGLKEFTQMLPSDRDRMSMLTGESDPPFKSRYGGRDEYDPVDRDFNRQFDDSPRGRQPWDSDPKGNPLERDPLEGYDTQSGRDVSRPTGRGLGSLGNVPPRVDSRPPRKETSPRQYWEGGRKWETQPAQSWDYGGDLRGSIPEGRTDITPEQRGVDTSATQNINKPAKQADPWKTSYSDRLKENYNTRASDPKDYDLEPRDGYGDPVSKNVTIDYYRKNLQLANRVGQGISKVSRVPKWDDILQVTYGNYGVPNTIGEVPSDYKRYEKPQVTAATQNINKPTSSYKDRLKENYNPYATDPKDYDLEPRYGTGSQVSKHATLEGYRKDLQYASSVGQGIGESTRIPKWDDILGVRFGQYGIPNTIGEIPSDYKPYKKPQVKPSTQVTPATQDLSGITERLSELEGRKPSWQEDRIKALEERKPDTSWKDPLSTLQTGQQQGQQARTALDQRLAALEDYYKKDPPPPPEERLGSRYEDKAAQYAKQWEVKNPTFDPDRLISEDRPNEGWGDWTYGKRGEDAWARDLPTVYKRNMRALNREYNKPTYEATIKGRDYKAYGYDDKSRLKMLDQQNIHEDEYLGSGTWTNQWGEKITGQGRGEQDRYFTSHSGLDPQSQEYKDRFRKDQKYTYSRPGGDYSWRGDDRGYEYRSHSNSKGNQDLPFENEFLDSSGRIVKTKGGQDYLWPDNPYS